jgi:hypothetical protein
MENQTSPAPACDASPALALAPGSAVGAYALPLTSTDALWNLCNETPIDIPRFILGKMLGMVDSYCAEADLDVKTTGDRAYITPRKCTINARGEQAIKKQWASDIPQNDKIRDAGERAAPPL